MTTIYTPKIEAIIMKRSLEELIKKLEDYKFCGGGYVPTPFKNLLRDLNRAIFLDEVIYENIKYLELFERQLLPELTNEPLTVEEQGLFKFMKEIATKTNVTSTEPVGRESFFHEIILT